MKKKGRSWIQLMGVSDYEISIKKSAWSIGEEELSSGKRGGKVSDKINQNLSDQDFGRRG